MTETISERYARLSQAFADKTAQVPADRWDAASPCEGWTAGDVVRHVADTPGIFFGMVGKDIGELPDDPVTAFGESRRRLLAALEDDATATTEFDGFFGRTSFQEAVDRFVNFDLVVHGWDLARTAGLDERIPEGDLERLEIGSQQFGEAARGPGVFGPALEPPAGADRQARLLCFLGRRP